MHADKGAHNLDRLMPFVRPELPFVPGFDTVDRSVTRPSISPGTRRTVHAFDFEGADTPMDR